jgi:glycine/D-amino acid oxidase-like deaminating enzyme
MLDTARLGLWLDQVGADMTPRPPLRQDLDVDVAIIGAGYTGLWTAYYLQRRDPSMRIAVLESRFAGFGASGRNGGWCSALLPLGWRQLVAIAGVDDALAMERALRETVDEVGRVTADEQLDIDFLKSGTVTLAMNRAQERRLTDELTEARERGISESDLCWLSDSDLRARVHVDGAWGGLFTPHCARLHPGKLVLGLASLVAERGVQLYEQTPVTAIEHGVLTVPEASVRAGVIVRATEGFTAEFPGEHRTLLPLVSSMIATAPLPDAVWQEIGWNGRETLNDGRHVLIYAQRTTDGRIAFGGRGEPYHYASRIDAVPDPQARIFKDLEHELHQLLPATRGHDITHRWWGPVGVSRDWFPSVGLDRDRGLAWAGGYAGDGVSTTNLAGRTLADLITGSSSELAALPWVGHHSPAWPPEPLRWLGVSAAMATMRSADRSEERRGRPARRAELLNRLIGR